VQSRVSLRPLETTVLGKGSKALFFFFLKWQIDKCVIIVTMKIHTMLFKNRPKGQGSIYKENQMENLYII